MSGVTAEQNQTVGKLVPSAYTSVGIPETGLYAVHHFRTDDGEHHVRGGIDIIGVLAIVVALAVIFYVLASFGFSVIERAWRQ